MIAAIEPILHSAAITPNDSADIVPCRALLVGAAGNVKVTYENGTVDTLYLAEGIWHAMYVRRVWSSGTTASGIHAGY